LPQLAQRAGLDRAAQRDVMRPEAELMLHHVHGSGPSRRVEHLAGFRRAQRQGFLAQHVFAFRERLQSERFVSLRRARDHDRIEARQFQRALV